MKIAVTFFKNKKENKIYKRISNKTTGSLNSINNQVCKIKNYQIVAVLILSIAIVMNSNNIICLATNISKINNLDITKENIIALNGIANSKNYTYTQIEQKEEIKIEDTTRQDFIAMDELAELYKEQAVFKNITSEDIKIIAETSSYQKINVCGVDITNYSTNRNIDFAAILNGENTVFEKGKDEVLLYTTHTSESYANSEKYQFEYTSPRRTTDGRYNMLAISSTLASNLNNKGINTVCSLTPHDYGEYNSAYSNSRRTMEALINENSNISISIDVHRDAIEDLEFAPKTNLKGYDVASLMFVMGIGYDGEENPYYAENLKLALELQILANKVYPGLFRPMIIRNSIYNQDLKSNSFLVEVGASGNTIDEAEIATRCLANLLNLIFKD
ncbi:MAG: stage II sporulation protein P [Clostridia bacterium]|nr:stage II sporulation protein P [Clostridia bacterium]